jgi:predicted acetyltransferase
MIQLVLPNHERANDYFDLCQEYAIIDNSNYNCITTIEKAKERILLDLHNSIQIDEYTGIKTLVYWVENDKREIIGTCRIRLGLNERFSRIGGHIGYDVRPKYRRNGYGTQILKMSLEEIRKNGVEKILLTCDEDNEGSIKVIERNGGKLEDTIYDEKTNKGVRRYWIE